MLCAFKQNARFCFRSVVENERIAYHKAKKKGPLSMRKAPDHECIALYKAGDGTAFDELVRRYQDHLYRYIFHIVRSRDEALDLTQDTLLKVLQGLESWEPDAPFRHWLFRIAHNTTVDALRHRGQIAYVSIDEDDEYPDGHLSPEACAQLGQRCRDLEVALGTLSPEHREVLILREFEEMSYRDIAETLRISEGTVKSRIARARAELAALCEAGATALAANDRL